MRLGDLVNHIPGITAAALDPETEISGLTADSRRVVPGMLFAALPGAAHDGRAYIADALGRGAAAILAPEGTIWPREAPPGLLLTALDARQALARMAAVFHGAQPETAIAVTGTNGKTSTVDFLRQLWTMAGEPAASIGTLGLIAEGFEPGPSLTTPDPVALHAMLAELAHEGITHAALEASSHGLDQRRLDGVRLAAAGFTNLTRDHLDYHGSMGAYRATKLRLFDTLLAEGGTAIAGADMDPETLAALRQAALRRRLELITVGLAGNEVRLLRHEPFADGQEIEIEAFGARFSLRLPLPGRFQADNALMAAALATVTGMPVAQAFGMLPDLKGVRGRMELAAHLPHGAAIYVDYAHTPDAIERLAAALRPHTTGRLHMLLGAGGDRDPGKRPLMGAAAARGADVVWITDDNPRGEDPALIRHAVLAGCPKGIAIAGRAAAIATAMADLRPGEILAVAGKGHETGQTIGGVTLPFDDSDIIRRIAGRAP